jgi:hypothetical protein
MPNVLSAGAARAFLHDVLDVIAFAQTVIVSGIEPGAMKEDFLAIIATDEAEAAIAHHLLDLALALRATRGRARTIARLRRSLATAAPSSATTGSAKAIGGDKFVSKKVERNRQVLKPILLG